MRDERNFLFVLSPNAGILDSWLPVLDRLAATPRVKLHALLPRPDATINLRREDFMVRNSAPVFSTVHFSSTTGNWASARTLIQARQKLALVNRIRQTTRWLSRNPTRRSQSEPGFDESATRAHLEQANLHSAEAILCDLSEHRKPYFNALLRAAPHARLYSVSQGLSIRELTTGRAISSEPSLPAHLRDRTASQFLLGKPKGTHYRSRFGLLPHQIAVTGIFRHDPAWLKRMHNPRVKQHLEPGSYVFLASRSASRRYLPPTERERSIRLVYEQARKRGLALVLRRHPFESDKRQIERWLGKEGKKNHWFETGRHPLDIGAASAIAVTLNSSVAVDMAAMGIPVMDPVDYSIFEEDAPNTRFDSHGRPISIYSQSGITIAASTEADFSREMDRLLERNIPETPEPSAEYRAMYADPKGSIERAMRRILEPRKA